MNIKQSKSFRNFPIIIVTITLGVSYLAVFSSVYYFHNVHWQELTIPLGIYLPPDKLESLNVILGGYEFRTLTWLAITVLINFTLILALVMAKNEIKRLQTEDD